MSDDQISKNFFRHEFACPCGCGFDTVDVELVKLLQMVRDTFDAPVTINSGCRCPGYNLDANGALNSQHLYGRAADIVVHGVHPDEVHRLLNREAVMPAPGLGKYSTFTHVDTRSGARARWNRVSN